MEQVTPVSRVELDEAAVRPPRYGILAPGRAESIATGAISRSALTSSRGGSRGSTSTEIESRSSFLIAAVAENRAREIGHSEGEQAFHEVALTIV
ncbi:hypothetical protein ON010_g5379 [Phytophthora cinnamomi]|nr:hypothetical protein ON010_g5379 [Phytophthora cinnamomi]